MPTSLTTTDSSCQPGRGSGPYHLKGHSMHLEFRRRIPTFVAGVNTLVSLSITAPNSIVGAAFTATFTFGEAVSGFVIGDISVTNGSASAFGGSGAVYTATITPTIGCDVTVSVAEGAATGDVSGFDNAADSLVVEYTTDARELENDDFRILENGDIRLLESA